VLPQFLVQHGTYGNYPAGGVQRLLLLQEHQWPDKVACATLSAQAYNFTPDDMLALTDAVPDKHATTSHTPLRISSSIRDDQTHQHSVRSAIAGENIHGEELGACGTLR